MLFVESMQMASWMMLMDIWSAGNASKALTKARRDAKSRHVEAQLTDLELSRGRDTQLIATHPRPPSCFSGHSIGIGDPFLKSHRRLQGSVYLCRARKAPLVSCLLCRALGKRSGHGKHEERLVTPEVLRMTSRH